MMLHAMWENTDSELVVAICVDTLSDCRRAICRRPLHTIES